MSNAKPCAPVDNVLLMMFPLVMAHVMLSVIRYSWCIEFLLLQEVHYLML